MTQYVRPSADYDNADGWVDEGAGSTDIYLSINDDATDSTLSQSASTPNDSDYIESPSSPNNDQYICDLGDIVDPQSSADHVLHYRYSKEASGGRTINLDIELRQGATTIASWSHNGISDTITQADQTLAGAEADAITDYSDLKFYVNCDQSGFSGFSRQGIIYWVEFETPAGVFEGDIAATAQAATFSGTAEHRQEGSAAATIQQVLFAGTAEHSQQGALGAEATPATFSGSGFHPPVGSMSAQATPAETAMSAQSPPSGFIEATATPAAASLMGGQTFLSTVAAVAQAATFAGTVWTGDPPSAASGRRNPVSAAQRINEIAVLLRRNSIQAEDRA